MKQALYGFREGFTLGLVIEIFDGWVAIAFVVTCIACAFADEWEEA